MPAAHSLPRGCYADFFVFPNPHEPIGGGCAVLVAGGGASPTLHFSAVGLALWRRAVSFLALFREAGILLSAMNGRPTRVIGFALAAALWALLPSALCFAHFVGSVAT